MPSSCAEPRARRWQHLARCGDDRSPTSFERWSRLATPVLVREAQWTGRATLLRGRTVVARMRRTIPPRRSRSYVRRSRLAAVPQIHCCGRGVTRVSVDFDLTGVYSRARAPVRPARYRKFAAAARDSVADARPAMRPRESRGRRTGTVAAAASTIVRCPRDPSPGLRQRGGTFIHYLQPSYTARSPSSPIPLHRRWMPDGWRRSGDSRSNRRATRGRVAG
jgi:hypothetical protein